MDEEPRGAALQRILDEAIGNERLEAWEKFVSHAQPIIASSVFRVLARCRAPRNDLVDDLVQETFLKLCANDYHFLRRFRSAHPGALVAYLRTIASTVAVDAYRVRSAQKRGAGENCVALEDFPAVSATHDHVEQVERELLIDSIDRCLSSQKERDRSIFWLYYRQGFTADAIAAIKIIELTSSGVESLIRRLTLAVRKCLKIAAVGQISPTVKGNSR
ncbi:MAG TPA: sigma-70 family RNA polymerase sigma factor [Bryobacteraceae bacterium]|nr:sigma-70 family RNA polymerase sigma factor [Bryobacteraceae bacterium]